MSHANIPEITYVRVHTVVATNHLALNLTLHVVSPLSDGHDQGKRILQGSRPCETDSGVFSYVP
jgi:hypothetical protein